MKEYTYTNRAYLGIKEGIVPPAPQYLWLNSKDDKLYKFGDNGWEVTNNASYIVDEFTVEDIVAQSTATSPKLTISRALLDAAYRGVPIMVGLYSDNSIIIPIDIDHIYDPSNNTTLQFRVKMENIEYVVKFRSNEIISGNKELAVVVNSYNSVDWNVNNSGNTGYVANRTHHLGGKLGPFEVGKRVSLAYNKGAHYIDNYKLLYEGKFYDLPTATKPSVDVADYFRITYNGYVESSSVSTYTITTSQSSESLPSQTFEVYRDIEDTGYKALDEFYLPDGAKPWKTINATPQTAEPSAYLFKDISSASISSGDNVLRNKTIYLVTNANLIDITVPISTPVLEFKINTNGIAPLFSTNLKIVWENGTLPTSGEEIIYSFLVLQGKIYASAKVYKTVK